MATSSNHTAKMPPYFLNPLQLVHSCVMAGVVEVFLDSYECFA